MWLFGSQQNAWKSPIPDKITYKVGNIYTEYVFGPLHIIKNQAKAAWPNNGPLGSAHRPHNWLETCDNIFSATSEYHCNSVANCFYGNSYLLLD